MTNEQVGYEVCYSDKLNDWYIVHRQLKGSVLHREILADRFDSEDAAREAIAALDS